MGDRRHEKPDKKLETLEKRREMGARSRFGRLERFGQALTGLSGGVGAPSIPQQLPNPAAQALSNALGIGNLFANIYGAFRPRT